MRSKMERQKHGFFPFDFLKLKIDKFAPHPPLQSYDFKKIIFSPFG
jgi:hypothetical protein